jgi:hypothetical protein
MRILNHLDLNGVSRFLNVPAPSQGGDVITKDYLEDAIAKALAGFDFQADVDGVQSDAELAPEAVAGKRYIVKDVSALNEAFGTIEDVGNGDIVGYDGSKFVIEYDVSEKGDGILVYARDEESYLKYVGGEWSFGGLTVIEAGTGLDNISGTFNVKFDNTTITLSAGGFLQIADDSIDKNKINANVAGQGLLQDSDGSLKIRLNDSRLTVDVEGLKLTETYTKKVAANVGDGVATEFNVTHSLGTKDVIVQILDNTTFLTVEADTIRPDLNSVTVQFAVAPTSSQYRVVIIG